jgi:hypothetical protein
LQLCLFKKISPSIRYPPSEDLSAQRLLKPAEAISAFSSSVNRAESTEFVADFLQLKMATVINAAMEPA